jgi:hypothetical protein
MPSGNSTLWEIKPYDLDSMNNNLFIPKFNLEILENDKTENNPIVENNFEIKANHTQMKKIEFYLDHQEQEKHYNSIFHAISIIENKNASEVETEDFDSIKHRFRHSICKKAELFSQHFTRALDMKILLKV